MIVFYAMYKVSMYTYYLVLDYDNDDKWLHSIEFRLHKVTPSIKQNIAWCIIDKLHVIDNYKELIICNRSINPMCSYNIT